MKAFKIEKILIPIDFSETSLLAIEHAAFTAQLFKADLILLHVVEKHWEKFNIIAPELRIEAPNNLINLVEKKLEALASDIRSKYGVKSICITSDGVMFTEVVNVSEEHNVDMIVMGTHGASGWVDYFVGSNAYKVITESKCPVISVQRHAKKLGFTNILLPVDDSAHSRQKINHAVVLAKHFAAKLNILGLVNSSDDMDLNKFELKLEQIEDYLKKCDVPYSKITVKGSNQAKLTYDYAKSIDADLIVIMTDQEESIAGRLLLGTYAQQVVNHSKIPVMSIHPVIENIPWVHPY